MKPNTILCVAATCGPLKVVASGAVDECGCHLPTGIMDYPVTHLLPHKYLFFHLDFQPDLTVKVCVILLRLVCAFLLRLLNTLSCTLFYLILFHYILQPSNVITPWKILRESSQDIAVACSHIQHTSATLNASSDAVHAGGRTRNTRWHAVKSQNSYLLYSHRRT